MHVSDADGCVRLLDFKNQERYYTKIVDRYMGFCSRAGRGDELLRQLGSLRIGDDGATSDKVATLDAMALEADIQPSFTSSASQDDLTILIMAMRKLREGIVASKRIDDFSIQAYIFCIRLSILVKHMESYQPALLHLLNRMHPAHSLSSIDLQEFAGYLVLDLACRRQDYAQAYFMKNKYDVRDSKVDAVLSAMVHDDYQKFWKVKNSVGGYKAKLMEFAETTIRMQALKCLGRTYFSVDLAFLEYVTDAKWQALTKQHGVGWELEGQKVVIRRPKGR